MRRAVAIGPVDRLPLAQADQPGPDRREHRYPARLDVRLAGQDERDRTLALAVFVQEIDLGADRRALIAAAPSGEGADALVELLAFSGPEFYAGDRERRYLEAYGLAAVLMRGGDATLALRELLVRQRADPCFPLAAEAVIDAKYPGGLAGLARDWTAFLRDPPATVRAY